MAASSETTPRILTRGETSQFQVSFFLDDAETTPLTPLTTDYPAYSILDPSGTVIQTGVGTASSPGRWTVQWQVPKDARLSYFNQTPQTFNDQNQGMDLTANDGRYRIEWQLVTDQNQQVQFVEEFDVRDTAITQSQNRELKYLTLAGDPIRLLYRTTALPYKATIRVYQRGQNTPLIYNYYDSTLPVGMQGGVQYAKDGDSYVLYYDVPAGVTACNTCYNIAWTLTESVSTPQVTEVQILTAISMNLYPLITSLRMLIDKFQKRLGRITSYEDSDLLEYIARGINLVNVQYPTTGYTLNNIPDPLLTYVLLGAGWYGLQSQKILNADMNINFTGQAVTLTVDATGIDGAASAMQEMFNTGLAAAKMAYVRRAGGMGTVATRAYSYRFLNDYVFKLNTITSTNDFLTVLTKIGLL
jgi:hypothetical protein